MIVIGGTKVPANMLIVSKFSTDSLCDVVKLVRMYNIINNATKQYPIYHDNSKRRINFSV